MRSRCDGGMRWCGHVSVTYTPPSSVWVYHRCKMRRGRRQSSACCDGPGQTEHSLRAMCCVMVTPRVWVPPVVRLGRRCVYPDSRWAGSVRSCRGKVPYSITNQPSSTCMSGYEGHAGRWAWFLCTRPCSTLREIPLGKLSVPCCVCLCVLVHIDYHSGISYY